MAKGPVPTPLSYGALLKLTPGADAQAVAVLTEDGCNVERKGYSDELFNNYRFLFQGPLSALETASFWIEFSSIYLPCLLRTYFTHAQSAGHKDDWIWQLMHQTVYHSIGFHSANFHPWFARFIRENPEESVGFFNEHIWRLTTGPEPQPREPLKEIAKFPILIFRHLLCSLLVYLPTLPGQYLPTYLLPEISARTADRLKLLCVSSYALNDTMDDRDMVMQPLMEAQVMLISMGTQRTKYAEVIAEAMIGEKDEHRNKNRGMWWRCEATMIPAGMGGPGTRTMGRAIS